MASEGGSPALAVEGVQCEAALSPWAINPVLISVCLPHINTFQQGRVQFPGCSQDYTMLFFKPFPFTNVLWECKSFQQAVLSHEMATAGRASRLSPPHRKALIPLRCSQPVQHLSHPHFEPPQKVSAFPRVQGFSAIIVGLSWFPVVFCSCAPKLPSCLNCPILVWEPSSPAVTARLSLWLRGTWGLSHVVGTFSPIFSSCIFLASLFSIPAKPQGCCLFKRPLQWGRELAASLQRTWGQIKGLSLCVGDSSHQQLCREGYRSKASPGHSLEMSASLSVPQTLKSTQLWPRGSDCRLNYQRNQTWQKDFYLCFNH